MRGEVLHYDEAHGFGFITGADGAPYRFGREDLVRAFPIGRGTQVQFDEEGERARRIVPVGRGEPTLLDPLPPPTVGREPPRTGQQRFGRQEPAATQPHVPSVAGEPGLWSYFWQAMTANYANFSGRARRKEYWGFVLFWWLGLVLLLAPAMILDFNAAIDGGTDDYSGSVPVWPSVFAGLFGLAGIVPWMAVSIRRQHDIGLSGWFFLVILIPSFGSLILLVFSLIPSQKHTNAWGPVPTGVDGPPGTPRPAA